MRLILGTGLAMILAAGAASMAAATGDNKEKCRVLAAPMGQASQSFSTMFVAMQGLDYSKISAEFTGEERAQFDKIADAQDRLMPIFEEYLYELETLALMMSRCSR